MTAVELKEARLRLGLTQTQMADALSTPFRTYQDWEGDISRIPGAVELAIKWVEVSNKRTKKREGK
jgi:DNA-binding transcriptional regulator YiaG